jgi:hypothetical protein
VFNFIKCPFCSGHESLLEEAAGIIGQMIAQRLEADIQSDSEAAQTALWNIRNVIENTAERREEYVPPICPTPGKRKYSNKDHTKADAAKWRQHGYRCECGYWHLSKQSATEHTSKINSPPADADEFDAIDPLML